MQEMGVVTPEEEVIQRERVRIIKAIAAIAYGEQISGDKVKQYLECVWPGLSREELLEIINTTIN